MIHTVSRYLRALACLVLSCTSSVAGAQLTLLNDMVLDPAALLMPSNATYGRAINGVSFQTEPLLTYGDYQYATWYHNGSDEDVYIGRRALSGNTWEVFDTGSNLDNGDASPAPGSSAWDAHNVISLGISGDARMHFSWDLHGQALRFKDSDVDDATGATWDASLLNSERSSLNPGGAAITTVTYPQFTTDKATGDMFLNFRTGSSGAGNKYIATYDAGTGLWNAPHEFINGTNSIFYDDNFGSSSNNRNAYLNGLDVDTTGRLHTTWTWRETATGSSNHDIMYAYSDDGGNTWQNNAGGIVGAVGDPIDMNSPGIVVVPMDRGNTLMNQQTQAVDLDNRVHTIMWHKRDDAAPVTGFTTTPAAYFHYFRDPNTGVWGRTELPTSRAVGSRPDMAYDENGNLYATYLSPGRGDSGGYYTNGDLIVASASKAAGYEDWEIVYTDTRDFAGEPFVDLQRLLNDDIVSVVIQENSPNTGKTSSALHVLEFEKLANKVVWAGDNTGSWLIGSGTDWDNDNNDIGDEAFENGFRVTFDDGAADFSINIAEPVAPTSTTFVTTQNDYVLTGEGIGGAGPLSVISEKTVTLANGPNTYSGETWIDSGTLKLTGAATIPSSPQIFIHEHGTLDVSELSAGHLPIANQHIAIQGAVEGNIASMESSITGTGIIRGSLLASQTTIRIGDAGMPIGNATTTEMIDDFSDGNLSEYTKTIVNDGNATANVTLAGAFGALAATYEGNSTHEQLAFLRDDVSLQIGDTLLVDVDMDPTFQQMDFGLAVSATKTPSAATGADPDTRDTFDWASVSIRPSQNNIRVNQSNDGIVNTATGTLNSVSETTVSQLYITRNSPTQFDVGYVNNSEEYIFATTVSFSATDVGTAFGFYADLRSEGTLGVFDNLKITRLDQIPLGQTLTIENDVVLDLESVLQFDIAEPGVGDLLVIGGNLHAGGLLSVALDPLAQAPALNDIFDILDFTSASGAFDAFDLPVLQAGFAWNVTNLLSTGVLEVVSDVDLDNDGDVDGHDFLAIQRTNPSLIGEWQGQYGNLIAVSSTSLIAVIPEPGAMGLLSFTVPFALLLRRTNK
jgi:autotransporter-associated beta strand protein